MSGQWRPFLAARRFVTHQSSLPHHALRFIPLVGIAIGCVGAGVYWLGAQLWPTSVAVVLALLATTLLDARGGGGGALYWVFAILLKYNALMALSAAHVPIPLPANLTLGLIMIAAHAASSALVVSVVANGLRREESSDGRSLTAVDFGIALVVGLAPAGFLGIPGLVGLVSAIIARLLLGTYLLPGLTEGNPRRLEVTRRTTEICFYLGALATWKYV